MSDWMESNDETFYRLGKIALLPGILGALFLLTAGIGETGVFPACVFREVTGLYCPGCGGTRAVYHLLKGEILKSFLYHPFVPYTAFVYAAFMSVTYYRKHAGKGEYRTLKLERYIYIGIAILLLQFLLKEALLIFFQVQWL